MKTQSAAGAAIAAVLFLCCASGVMAQASKLEQPPKLEPVPDGSPNRDGNSADDVEPQVTIRQSDDNRIEEYRVHGKLYAIRVIPKIGVPYTLVDRDGSGNMVRADDPAGVSVKPPRWTLLEF